MRRGRRGLLLGATLAAAGLLSACEQLQYGALRVYLAANPHLEVEDGPLVHPSERGALRLVPIADGLEFPWGVAFPAASEALITEKPGRVSRVDLATGARRPIAGPPEAAFVGQGGLLDVALDPAFASNRLVYLSHSIPVPPDGYTTRVTRAVLDGDRLVDPVAIFTAEPVRRGVNHFGGALVFGRDGMLYVAVGDRQERAFAQDLGADLGKIHRMRSDGTAPADNPFAGNPDARPTIYTWGHRNPQGLAVHPERGDVWAAEHGPQGGDEINALRPGRNYGWPIICHGEEYGGGKIGVGTHREGLEQPVHHYTPSIAPSGIAFYSGDALPEWRGNLFVAALRLTHLNRLVLDGEVSVHEERLFADLWHRVRNVAESPFTRELFVVTENGTLFRIDPEPPS